MCIKYEAAELRFQVVQKASYTLLCGMHAYHAHKRELSHNSFVDHVHALAKEMLAPFLFLQLT